MRVYFASISIIIFILISISLVFTVNAQNDFAYGTLENKFLKPPLVCIYDVNDSKVRNIIKEKWINQVSIGIKNWQIALENYGIRQNNNWPIEINKISITDDHNFDNSLCDVEVKLTKIQYEDNPDAAGWHWYDGNKNQIRINYLEQRYCGFTYTEAIKQNIPTYCFDVGFKRSGQIGNIATHEFGHALGLGHYISYNEELNEEWSKNQRISPSIMTITTHYNEEENPIRPIDLDKITEIYGESGFKKCDPVKQFGSESHPCEFEIIDKIIEVKPNNKVTNKILEGEIPQLIYIRGVNAEIEIKDPNDDIRIIPVEVSSNKKFDYKIPFEYHMTEGTYEIRVNYEGSYLQKIDVHLIKISESIPNWIKNNAKLWIEEKINDELFIQGIQYLISERIIDVSVKDASQQKAESIPNWIKNNAKLWIEEKINDELFIQGIEFLIKKGIIVIR